MPLVIVFANRSCEALSGYEALKQLGPLLQQLVAQALTCDDPGGELTAVDVEVDLKYRDPKWNIGGDQYDLQIVVFANDFPSRKANLEERCRQLRDLLRDQTELGGVKGYVWIRLAPAAFAEF